MLNNLEDVRAEIKNLFEDGRRLVKERNCLETPIAHSAELLYKKEKLNVSEIGFIK